MKLQLGVNFAVFLAFFGLALLETIQNHNWFNALAWVVVGAVFLFADNHRHSKQSPRPDLVCGGLP